MADTITVTGVVGTDPQLGDAGGTPVCNFRLASSLRRYDKQTGRWTEYGTNWYSVGAYRYLGKNVVESLKKGDRVVVTGRIRLREWENQTGRGMTVDIDASSIGHDLTWGTTTFRKHDSDSGRAGGAPTDDDDAFQPVVAQTEVAHESENDAPLHERVDDQSAKDWSAVSIGEESEEAA